MSVWDVYFTGIVITMVVLGVLTALRLPKAIRNARAEGSDELRGLLASGPAAIAVMLIVSLIVCSLFWPATLVALCIPRGER